MSKYILCGLLFIGVFFSNGQDGSVNWITFEELEVALENEPRKVLIHFYTDWCQYCKQMEKKVFTNSKVIEVLNEKYYAVKFNAETTQKVRFEGAELINDQVEKSRRPLHQIAQILAVSNGEFVAPTILILDDDFVVKKRFFEFMDTKWLLKELR